MTEERRKIENIGFQEFLVSRPPGSFFVIEDLTRNIESITALTIKDIIDYCDDEICKGKRSFALQQNGVIYVDKTARKMILSYKCRNCQRTIKDFALIVFINDEEDRIGFKMGQYPPFGPPIPSRAISLIGPDRELFLKGRSSENIGLGVGSFAYYRRILEQQWRRLVDEIIKVAQKTGLEQDKVNILSSAKSENQFSKAVDMVKDVIPSSLYIRGYNPLSLLYSALSEGVHAKSDEECLELAHSVRTVLYELADRIGAVLQDNTELDDAVKRLAHRNQ